MPSNNTEIVPLDQRVDLLRTTQIFDGLDEKILGHIAGRMKENQVAAGRHVVRKGGKAYRFFVIAAGTANVTLGEGASLKQLATLGPGEFFGEMALLDSSQIRLATVTAKKQLLLLSLETETFQEILASHPEISANLKTITEKRNQINEAKKAEPDKPLPADKIRQIVDKLKWW